MQPIFQTKFGPSDGNCLAACLASVFGVALEQVERTIIIAEGAWRDEVDDFVAQFGYAALCIPACYYLDLHSGGTQIAGKRKQAIDVGFPSMKDCYYVAVGPGPRELKHAVVFKGDQMIHDPMIDGDGLERIDEIIVFVKKGELEQSNEEVPE